MNESVITIIDDKNLRGIVGPSSVVSKEMLEDLVDFIEMSSTTSIDQDDSRIKEADRADSWIPFGEAKKRAKKTQ
ncbi:MAG: hypothetical protein Q7S26_02365 [bacterium]|nr:hypothetical protein [bacterium]